MFKMPCLAELAPIPRLIVDEKPPIATRIWLITKYGSGYAGIYDKHDTTVVAWCPLPKLSEADKARLREIELQEEKTNAENNKSTDREQCEQLDYYGCVRKT